MVAYTKVLYNLISLCLTIKVCIVFKTGTFLSERHEKNAHKNYVEEVFPLYTFWEFDFFFLKRSHLLDHKDIILDDLS